MLESTIVLKAENEQFGLVFLVELIDQIRFRETATKSEIISPHLADVVSLQIVKEISCESCSCTPRRLCELYAPVGILVFVEGFEEERNRRSGLSIDRFLSMKTDAFSSESKFKMPVM